jgi:RNA polymerase sigma factor (sigma-70 family)
MDRDKGKGQDKGQDKKNIIFEFFAAEQKKFYYYVRNKLHYISDMEAEDIVEDVMLSMFNQSIISSRIDNLAAYVYRSLRNKIVDYQRSSPKTISLQSFIGEDEETSLIELLTDNAGSVNSYAEKREFYRRLSEAISSLEPRQRAVFIATEIKGKSFKQLSEAWDEPIGTLLSRKSRAVKVLREKLKDFSGEF